MNSTSIKLFKENVTAPERKICQLHGEASQRTPMEDQCKQEWRRDGDCEHIPTALQFRAAFLCDEVEYQ